MNVEQRDDDIVNLEDTGVLNHQLDTQMDTPFFQQAAKKRNKEKDFPTYLLVHFLLKGRPLELHLKLFYFSVELWLSLSVVFSTVALLN